MTKTSFNDMADSFVFPLTLILEKSKNNCTDLITIYLILTINFQDVNELLLVQTIVINSMLVVIIF